MYLKAVHDGGGCRGGAGHTDLLGMGLGGDYAIEIGAQCNCDPELLALAELAPVVKEFLTLSKSPMAALILAQWMKYTEQLTESERNSKQERMAGR
jgi:hypothetical protein